MCSVVAIASFWALDLSRNDYLEVHVTTTIQPH